MSVFSECLREIKEQRNWNNAKMASEAGVDKSRISRWMKGENLPQSWKLFEAVMDELHLTNEEQEKLKKAYDQTLLGEKKYRGFRKVSDILELLQMRNREYEKTVSGFVSFNRHIQIPDYRILENNIEILQHIRCVLDYLAAKEEKKLYVRMQTDYASAALESLNLMLKLFLGKVENCQAEIIIAMPKKEEESSDYKLDVFKTLFDVLVQKNEVNVYLDYDNENLKGLAGNYIFSEDFLLQFDKSMEYGMITGSPEWIEFVRASYGQLKETCELLYKKRPEMQEFITRNNVLTTENITVEHAACLGCGLTKEILETYLYDELPGKEQVVQLIHGTYSMMQNPDLDSREKLKVHTFFRKEGLIEFMESGRFEVFPYDVYRAIELPDRCVILDNVIKLIKAGRLHQHIFKEHSIHGTKDVRFEYIRDHEEQVLITLSCEEGPGYVIEIQEKEIIGWFKEFFVYIENSDEVYTAEETVEYMEQVLREYRNRG